MNTPELIPLELVDANPYQPREREDPEHVKQVAMSIAEQGLLQVPIGRRVNGRVELAFGHTRLAAYRWLADVQPSSNLDGDWTAMPVVLQELSDIELFELAISENIDRRDLTPIEQARAMLVYRETFGKTSAEIGKLFGLSESAVRNKLRLLDLPETVQAFLDGGELSEGTARKLMVLDKLAPARVAEVAEKITQNEIRDPEVVSDQIQRAIREETNQHRAIREMWNGKWNKGEPRAGSGLWPLTWTPDKLPELTFAQFQKLYDGPQEFRVEHKTYDGLTYSTEIWTLKHFLANAVNSRWRADHAGRVEPDPAPVYELLDQLLTPPACSACPRHATLDGVHYCGLAACWQRKRQAWYEQELARVVEKLGIPVYDKEHDPKELEMTQSWGSNGANWRKWLKEKAPHLRLRARYQEYQEHFLTGSHCVELVSVRPEIAERKRQEVDREANQRQVWEQQNRKRQAAERFRDDVAVPAFAPLTAGLKPGALAVLSRAFGKSLVERALANICPWSDLAKGPVEVARTLAGVAKEAGIKLPEDWLEIAEKFGEVQGENTD